MMRRLHSRVVPPAVLFVAALAGPAFAGDGVIEIDQAAALAGGVTPGDGAGFPVELYTEGSYRLTGNLSVASEDTSVILVRADNITIDLSGFAILGPVTCTGTPVTSCTPSGGTGNGIGYEPAPPVSNVTVLNGTVRGIGKEGISLGRDTRIEGLRVIENGRHGIFLNNTGNLVNRSTAQRNGSFGMTVAGGQIIGSWAEGNQSAGITMQGGIGGLVVDCTMRDNGGFGLALAGGGYRGNVIENNTSGSVTGSGDQLGDNVCNGDTTCP